MSLGYTLVISVGNSNTVFAAFAGNKFVGKWRLETRAGRSADEYGMWLLQVLQKEEIPEKYIQGVCIACAVPNVETNLISMARRYFDCEPLFVSSGIKTGMKVNYGRVGDLSPDRLANIVAVNTYYKSCAIVVDFGTTTTFDVISETGTYLGGSVAPGVGLALDALARTAPRLPGVALEKPKSAIGHNIVESMQSGCYWGAMDTTIGLVNRIWKELDMQGICIATGGFAKEMVEGTNVFEDVDTNLTLKGLKILYDKNYKQN